MTFTAIFDASDVLAEELMEAVAAPRLDETPRIRISDIACSLSLEHWTSTRALLRLGLLPSAVAVHRAQFEALARSVWLLYAATDAHLAKLDVPLSLASEQAAKNMSTTLDIMQDLEKHAPRPAYEALCRFKDHSWKALNSYVHAGIHPLRRHEEGYPVPLLQDVLRNANGLAVVACMQAVVLSGTQKMQQHVLALAARHPECMPPAL